MAKGPKTMFARARSLRDSFPAEPNQHGCATRAARTGAAREVGLALRLSRAQGDNSGTKDRN